MYADEQELCDVAELYRVFGDKTRVTILYTLVDAERGVSEIAETMGMSLSAVSHQLRILKGARLVRARRVGKTVFYALADDHVRTVIGQGMEHVTESNEKE